MPKLIHFQAPEEVNIEFNCKCCEALGIADIVREMIEKDLRADLRQEARQAKKKLAKSTPKKTKFESV